MGCDSQFDGLYQRRATVPVRTVVEDTPDQAKGIFEDVCDAAIHLGEMSVQFGGSYYREELPRGGAWLCLYTDTVQTYAKILAGRLTHVVLLTQNEGQTFEIFRPGRWMAHVAALGERARKAAAAKALSEQQRQKQTVAERWERAHSAIDDSRWFDTDAD